MNDLISLQIVHREELDDYQQKVRYSLTPKGKLLFPIIQEMAHIVNEDS
ncbi:winged helix-turn-helix transcriptional regulator [Staphylococcus epidermidis]